MNRLAISAFLSVAALAAVQGCSSCRCADAKAAQCACISAEEPRISVFASFIRRIAKQRGISKAEAAELLYGMGVRGFDAGPGEADLDELAATRLKPINFYYFPDWFGRKDKAKTVSPEACLARAAELGVPRIMVVPPNFTDGKDNPEEFERMLGCMKGFVAEAKKRSITVTVEDFGGVANCCSYAKYLKRFLSEVPDLRFALDSGNLYYAGRGEDILEMMEFAKSRIGHVHLKDQTAANNREYATLGLGAVPNEQIVKAVAATGYDGWYTLENPVGDVYNDSVRQVALLKAWLAAAKSR
jgi:sugar phosphate isomerase/epimerase